VKVYHHIDSFQTLSKPAVVTTGTFDGVHIGHQKIIKRLRDVASKVDGEIVVLTFYPHPRSVLNPDSDIKLLNAQEEKIALLERFGVDHLIIHPFSKEFARTTSVEFVRDILVNKIGTKKLVIGYDHHFGRNREGSFEHLVEFGPMYGFEVEEITALDVDHVNVSSTKIRNALLEGDLETARTYLSYDYAVQAQVVEGKKIGRQIGFPTANLDVENSSKLIPANGVYAVMVRVDNVSYKGMLNIGTNPTVTDENVKRMEVNIFQFDEQLYGKEVKVIFKYRLRDEEKFNSIDELKAQMELDKENSLRLLA
tara:strand:- start:303 stop:1232 length:930 start_codon:yes stop_codon:yes gene_type:complete